MNPFYLPLLPDDVALVELGRTYVGGTPADRLFLDRDGRLTAALRGQDVQLLARRAQPTPAMLRLGIPALAALAGAARYWARER